MQTLSLNIKHNISTFPENRTAAATKKYNSDTKDAHPKHTHHTRRVDGPY